MYGSFQFEILTPSASPAVKPAAFSARVARLALSASDGGERTPCPRIWEEDSLSSSSVRATRRVIVGARVDFLPQRSDPQKGVYTFAYDCQINNARAQAVRVVGHQWEVQTAAQASRQTSTLSTGDGVGGRFETRHVSLPAGEAFRVQGLLSSDAPVAKAYGFYSVVIETEEAEELVEVEIGAVALTAVGER
mmetsp:Transcript_66433/g.131717  ORF Transcript_66433/g.131717 Transcript_66433/m.131717 type:complete len:192 (+) Transcript_66433:707-1282(+)